MLIQIKRLYLNSGEEVNILINTLAILTVEPSNDPDKPDTRIVMQPQLGDVDARILYTNETVQVIKTKYTKAMNAARKIEQ